MADPEEPLTNGTAHEEPAHARAHQAAALLSGNQPEDGRHTHKGLSIERLQDNSDSNLKALDDSPHHISESVSQELSRDGEASVADIEGSAAPGSTRLHPGDRPIEAEALPLEEASKLPAEPLPSEPWADLEVGLHHQHGNTAGAADQQQQGHWEGRDKRQQPVTLSADEAEQARQRASLAEEARKTIQQARNSLSEAASDRSSSVDSAVSDQLSERMRRQSQALRLSSSEIRRLAISERDSAEEQAARHLLQEEEPKARQEARLIAMKERAEVAASLAEAQAMQSMAEQPGSQMDQLTEEIARIKRAEQALIDAEDAEQMAAELYVLERQLSSLRHSVPAEVADAAQEAKRQAKATVHQAMSSPTEAGEDVSECAAAGSGLDEPASSGASDTSAFSGITDALLSNPKFSAGAEGGREERQGSDRSGPLRAHAPPSTHPSDDLSSLQSHSRELEGQQATDGDPQALAQTQAAASEAQSQGSAAAGEPHSGASAAGKFARPDTTQAALGSEAPASGASAAPGNAAAPPGTEGSASGQSDGPGNAEGRLGSEAPASGASTGPSSSEATAGSSASARGSGEVPSAKPGGPTRVELMQRQPGAGAAAKHHASVPFDSELHTGVELRVNELASHPSDLLSSPSQHSLDSGALSQGSGNSSRQLPVDPLSTPGSSHNLEGVPQPTGTAGEGATAGPEGGGKPPRPPPAEQLGSPGNKRAGQAAEDQLPPKAAPLVKSEAQTQPGQRQQQEASQWSTAESGEGAATIRAAGVADDEGANALADPADNNEAAPIVVAHAEDAEEAPAADASSSPPQIDKVQAQHYPAPPGPPATPPPQQDPASAATPSTGQRPFSPPPGRAPLGPGPEQQQQEPPGFSDPARYPQPPPDMPRPYGTRDQNGPVPFTEPEEFAGMLYHDGVDSLGRPVVVVDVDAVSSAVPVRKAAMHYLLERLEPIVIQGPYVLVMVSTGRSGSAKSKQLPALWFVSAYRGLSRPFKKNVKYVVLVRPTGWLKTLLAVVRPVTSRKSARKLKKLDSLSQLAAATNNEVTLQHLGTRFAAACGDFILQGLPSSPASQPFREGITYAMPNF